MASFHYPTRGDLRLFIEILQEKDYPIKKYLPPVDEEWFQIISDCIEYVQHVSQYEECGFLDSCARLLYKIAKRHELGDGNKRSSVIGVYLFCLLNDYYISEPKIIKQQAKRIASTKGRLNEDMMRKRVVKVLSGVVRNINSIKV